MIRWTYHGRLILHADASQSLARHVPSKLQLQSFHWLHQLTDVPPHHLTISRCGEYIRTCRGTTRTLCIVYLVIRFLLLCFVCITQVKDRPDGNANQSQIALRVHAHTSCSSWTTNSDLFLMRGISTCGEGLCGWFQQGWLWVVVTPSSCQTERAVHCSSLQPECGGPWGCTRGKALATMASVPVLACLGSL